jgi:hypothetical protein
MPKKLCHVVITDLFTFQWLINEYIYIYIYMLIYKLPWTRFLLYYALRIFLEF